MQLTTKEAVMLNLKRGIGTHEPSVISLGQVWVDIMLNVDKVPASCVDDISTSLDAGLFGKDGRGHAFKLDAYRENITQIVAASDAAGRTRPRRARASRRRSPR